MLSGVFTMIFAMRFTMIFAIIFDKIFNIKKSCIFVRNVL